MPLQVTVIADGYEQQVYRRIEAKAKGESDEIVFPMLPIDESKLIAIRGRIVDMQDRPIVGAEIRLITADKMGGDGRRARVAPRDYIAWNEYPYNWQMIESGQVGSVDGVSQFLSTVSDKNGAFAFERIRPASLMQIAYWGEGVSRGRREQLERLSEEERRELIIRTETPGTLRGKIDRQALPEVSSVELQAIKTRFLFDTYRASIKANQNEYEIRNVPPGEYHLQVYGAAVRTERDSFRSKVIERREIEMKAGKTLTIDLGRPQ
jgi:hypothetical protein